MKIAIMQPYIFPYIGYFQLIHASDVFVFYDDVNFIKKGYINRNSILVNNQAYQFTIPCIAISQNKKINDIQVDHTTKVIDKLHFTLDINYKKAPYFDDVMPILTGFFDKKNSFESIGHMAVESVKMVAKYIGLTTTYQVSSKKYEDTGNLYKADRLIAISKRANASAYINPIGGQNLYSKKQFQERDLELFFLQSKNIKYQQFTNRFVPWLSVIDVLMFNSVKEIRNIINEYELI